jgi:hypothetical protein
MKGFIMHEPIIIYGEGWVSKHVGHEISTMYYAVAGFKVEDNFVQEFIKRIN